MATNENSKQPKKFWELFLELFGLIGAVASIWSLIRTAQQERPWYVYVIIVVALVLFLFLIVFVIFWTRRNKKNEEYIASCLDNDDFRNYWNEPIYIPLDIQEEDPVEKPNAKRIKLKDTFLGRFFKQKVTIDSHYACILGDSGSGKTAALVHLLIDYVKKYTFGVKPYDIKLYSMSMGDEELWKKINRDIPEKDRGKYILLLDALDENLEAQQALNNPNITLDSYLQGLVDKAKDFARVVVTCRQQFFPQKEVEPDKVNRRQHWEKYYISPFSDKQVWDFLTKKFGVPNNAPHNEQARKIVFGNKDVFLRPLILSNIDDILNYYGSDKEELTTKEIYEAIVQAWIKNAETDDEAKRNNLLQMSLSLAAYMYKHRINAVDELQYQKFLKEYSLIDPTNEFRRRSLLHRCPSGYRFSHKSFYDYFLAYWLFLHPKDIGSVQSLNKTLQFYDEILVAVSSGNITEIDKVFETQKALSTATTIGMGTWASRLDDQCQYRNAEYRYSITLSIYRKLSEDNPNAFLPDVAGTLNNLAVLHCNTHDYDAAVEEYREALEIRRQLAADNPDAFLPDVAGTLNNLANLHSDTHDYDAAVEEYREALDTYRQLAADNPDAFLPDVATTLNNLAILHRNIHDYDAAIEEYGEALEIRRQLAADNPDAFLPDVAGTLNNLANLHSDTHDYDAAVEEYGEALDTCRQLATDNPDAFLPYVATTLNNLANLHCNTHDYDAAVEEYREALEIRRKLAAANPDAFLPDVAMTLFNIAILHIELKQLSLAEEAASESLEIYTQIAEKSPAAFGQDKEDAQGLLDAIHKAMQ